jgi:hypothetical protein
VLDGDVAFQKGEPEDYRLAGELHGPLAEARIPLHLTLGNHDHRDNFRAGLLRGAARSPLVSRAVTVLETDRASWFLLDTLDRVAATPGALGKAQLDWLAGALDARPGKPALVVLHHNPQWPAPAKPTGLVDAERLFGVVAPRKQVKALVFGHTHQWGRDRHEGVHLINLPPVAYLFTKGPPTAGWTCGCGRAGPSSRCARSTPGTRRTARRPNSRGASFPGWHGQARRQRGAAT